MTKLCDFPYPIYYVTKNLISYLWPDSFCCWLYYLACVAGVKQGRGRQSADGKEGRDEEVASSKKEPNWSAKTTWFDSLVKLIPYLWPKRLKNRSLWGHTYLCSPYNGVPIPRLIPKEGANIPILHPQIPWSLCTSTWEKTIPQCASRAFFPGRTEAYWCS